VPRRPMLGTYTVGKELVRGPRAPRCHGWLGSELSSHPIYMQAEWHVRGPKESFFWKIGPKESNSSIIIIEYFVHNWIKYVFILFWEYIRVWYIFL
jgi:hypothetical protein